MSSDTLSFRCPSCGRINRVAPQRIDQSPTCGACHARLDVSGAPVHLDDDELERLVSRSPVPVLVDFYADWCGPCRMLAPTLEELGRRYAGRLIIAKVDTDRHPRTAQQLGVRGIPALYLYDGGRVVDQRTGVQSLAALEQMVRGRLAA